jgi:hypothetical protein
MKPKRVLRPDGTIQDLARPLSTYTTHEQDCILDGSFPNARQIMSNLPRIAKAGNVPVQAHAVIVKEGV